MSDKPASPARGRKKTASPAQQPPQEEVVVRLPLTDLHPFPDHPFQVRDDEEMRETIQSVKEYGVIVPAIVRPREEGGYEIVAGHRRKYACEQAGLDTMPVLIRNLDRDAATIIMVETWTGMRPPSSWWTATFSGRTSFPAKGPRRTR